MIFFAYTARDDARAEPIELCIHAVVFIIENQLSPFFVDRKILCLYNI